jgi:Domain of unknown function (DUF5655)/Domain of unknown function (DUF4287)
MAKKAAKKAGRVVYSVHPAIAHVQAVIDNMPEKTGRSLDEWVAMVEKGGPAGEKERIAWLKGVHQLGATNAGIIAEVAAGKGGEYTDRAAYLDAAAQYVEAMYHGAKAGLRPIHDALVDLVVSLGKDVKICPCSTIVPFYRNHVFAQTRPATRTRVDFGLALKGVTKKIPKRLIDTGGLKKGDRITHRFPLESPDEIDDQVREWCKIAYDLDG